MHDPDYDAFCRQRLENPHPFYARLREQEPVHWCESMHMWFLSRYDDISALIRDRRRLISSRQSMYTDPLLSENRELASGDLLSSLVTAEADGDRLGRR